MIFFYLFKIEQVICFRYKNLNTVTRVLDIYLYMLRLPRQ